MTLTGFVSKNAFRNKRRSILTVLSIGFSLLLLTLMMTIWHAFYIDQGSVQSAQRLVVRHKGLTECVVMDGPAAEEADAVLKINLSALAFNFATLARNTDVDCAAVLECNAYGCGIDLVADALAKSGCRTFFVAHPVCPRAPGDGDRRDAARHQPLAAG